MNVVSSKSPDGIQSRPVLIHRSSGVIGGRLTTLLTERNISVRICDLRPGEALSDLWAPLRVLNLTPPSRLHRGHGQ
jgi:hypothetical protein